MTVKISKPAINLREELASLRNQGGLPKEDKLYVDTLENGDFSAGTVGWTGYNYLASVSASNGQLTVTSTGTSNGSFAYQKINTKIGKTYKVTATIVTTGQAYVRANKTTIHPWNYDGAMSFLGSANVTKEFTFVASQDHIYIGLGTSNASVGLSATYSSIIVQEVGKSIVLNGEFNEPLNSSANYGWAETQSPTSVTFGSNGVTIVPTNYTAIEQYVPVEIGKTYTVVLDVTALNPNNANDRGRLYLGVSGDSDLYLNDNTLEVGTHSFTITVSNYKLRIRLATAQQTGQVTFDNVRVYEGAHEVIQSIPYGYDVKDVYIDGELAREGEGYDYEVKTDGINQWLKPTVEPTATTETVVIGVRK